MKIQLVRLFCALYSDKRAVTIIEYALLAALIGIALVTSLGSLKNSISSEFSSISTSL